MSVNLSAEAIKALSTLGLSENFTIGLKEPFAMIGEKGLSPGTA